MTDLLKIAPVIEPVSLAEMRAHLGITDASDTSRDVSITAHIKAAREYCENLTRKGFITQTWVQYCDSFKSVHLLKQPLQSVVSVEYYPANGGPKQAILSTNYYVDLVSGALLPSVGFSWPDVISRPNSVEIEYIIGYGSAASDVPESIRDAIKFATGHLENFQNSIQGATLTTMPYQIGQLLNMHADYRIYF